MKTLLDSRLKRRVSAAALAAGIAGFAFGGVLTNTYPSNAQPVTVENPKGAVRLRRRGGQGFPGGRVGTGAW